MPVASDSGTLARIRSTGASSRCTMPRLASMKPRRSRATKRGYAVSGTWQTSVSSGATRAAISVYAASSASALISDAAGGVSRCATPRCGARPPSRPGGAVSGAAGGAGRAPTGRRRRRPLPRRACGGPCRLGWQGLMDRSYGWTAARSESTSRSRTARRCRPDAREACPPASRRRGARRSSRARGGTARRGSAAR